MFLAWNEVDSGREFQVCESREPDGSQTGWSPTGESPYDHHMFPNSLSSYRVCYRGCWKGIVTKAVAKGDVNEPKE